tara:strand:- start:93 stop:314 length:222 start_codon:yes stop_codon:yes gene_type:complete
MGNVGLKTLMFFRKTILKIKKNNYVVFPIFRNFFPIYFQDFPPCSSKIAIFSTRYKSEKVFLHSLYFGIVNAS